MGWSDCSQLLAGFWVTIGISVAAVCIGVPCGLGLALIRWRQVPRLDGMVATLVSFLRAIPSVTLILLVYFAFPAIGLSLNRVEAAILVLAAGTMAFDCEIWRGALLAFPRDQLEAAIACGMPRGLRFRRIVLPQIARACLPALINEVTLVIKVSPAVAVIGLVDTTRAAIRIGADTYEPLKAFMASFLLYAVLIAVILAAQRLVVRRLGASA